MPSVDKPLLRTLERWNRKLHFYLGLYLLFFVWLFAFSGLLLNHPQWTFAEFWPQRKQSSLERAIHRPGPGPDVEQARDIMRQLGIRGEIEWTTTRPDASHLDFRVSRPGHMYEIRSDLERQRAGVQAIELNGWGMIHVLHTFTGVRAADETNTRDWVLTTIWALSMDAAAAGLILMVVSSLYMWWRLKPKRGLGLLSLGLGVAASGMFLFGFRWFL